VVHPAEEGSHHVYCEPADILTTSWKLYQENRGALTEQDLINLVETAYAGRVLVQHPEFLQIRADTRDEQRRQAYVLDNPRPGEESALTTRLEKYHQVSVIPEALAEKARGCAPWARRLLELKMPIWYVRQHKSDQYSEELPLCKMRYDADLGGQFLPTQEAADPGCVVF
jgi:hypothetical protein